MGQKTKTDEEISKEIEEIIKKTLESETTQYSIKYSIMKFSLDELAVDSLRSVELILSLEEWLKEYTGKEIDLEPQNDGDCQWSHRTTVEEIIEFIKKLTKENV